MALTRREKTLKLLGSLTNYIETHPEERFWQAIRSWCGVSFIYVTKDFRGIPKTIDTFYFEDKLK